MGLQTLRGVGAIGSHTAAGPPLVPQVRQLAGFTQLEDGDGEVLYQRGTWRRQEEGGQVGTRLQGYGLID